MSVEEEIELKDLIAQTLKENGTLAKIKAQLRASVFLALDEDEELSKQKPFLNNKIKSFLESDEGKAMFYIVHEFLQYFNLYFTLAVYEPESYIDCNYQPEEKQRLLQQLGLAGDVENGNEEPLLYQLLKLAQTSKKNLQVKIDINGSLQHQEIDSHLICDESEISSLKEDILDITEDRVKKLKVNNGLVEKQLNTTFDVHSPFCLKDNPKDSICNNSHCAQVLDSSNDPDTGKSINDTFDDASSLLDDLDLVNQNIKVPDVKRNGIEPVDAIKEKNSDKSKSTSLKSKTNFNSDLPPISKRVNDILPSLYNKKDKSNNREIDKFFDTDVEYEEDFDMSSKSEQCNLSLLEELEQSNKSNNEKTALGKKEEKPKSSPRILACTKQLINSQKNKKSNDSLEINGGENIENASESF
ncbi:unnamed protein product [Phyllotreta striolata]|uniref:FGFR1 oncogene partner (FOP) N-terminal dimerisation domain-containing protein n=1 Tax=Phyllotreta striolata TaxID=444603 RepID=A0A9N9TU28_PHYSR|nr:unnamed protein product [Phyllotreta striolata]